MRWTDSLSARLFAITLASILLIEALIFVPSASGVRTMWLNERIEASRIAALALEAAPMRSVSDELSRRLLMSAGVLAVAEIEDDMRFQLLAPPGPLEGSMYEIDLRESTGINRTLATLGAFVAPADRVLVVSAEGSTPERVIEIVVPHAPLKASLIAFGWRILGLSLLIALVAAGVIYLLLHRLVVHPMQMVAISVEQFRRDPGSWTRRLAPTRRKDEIGRAQNALADMEVAVADAFRQRAHLAELGSAVAKINHDLRNSLASAQLVSEVLSKSDDPRVQRAAPRLERALERAIGLATATLDYGKAKPVAPVFERVSVRAVIDEATEEALSALPDISLHIDVPESLTLETDPDHLHRIVANLVRNAAEAMKEAGSPSPQIRVRIDGQAIAFADTGPGLPRAAQDNLFRPFAGSSRSHGTGLGLVIAHELAIALGGDLHLSETGPAGTTFRLSLPGLPG